MKPKTHDGIWAIDLSDLKTSVPDYRGSKIKWHFNLIIHGYSSQTQSRYFH